eukprot:2205291-Pyramimonas_sp.AAC.1
MLANLVDPNKGDYDRRTPMHLACANGQNKVVKALLARGAQGTVRDRWGQVPLADAINSHQQAGERCASVTTAYSSVASTSDRDVQNIPVRVDWSVMRIYLRFLRLIGPDRTVECECASVRPRTPPADVPDVAGAGSDQL